MCAGYRKGNDFNVQRATQYSAREAAPERARLGFSGVVDSHDANEAGWDIDEDFPEVPHEWPREERWDVKLKGKWRHAENIYELDKFSAWALGCNVPCAVRWIPSELNAADKPSRSLEPAKGKQRVRTLARSGG